ncbi:MULTISPECIES: hypothetical protein [unclassified Streptomyces]|uniref:hypothetical protein n=1 Tax=unclassified Streptomyces TaxID=2593676 RepID=UPI001F166862|nr:MULTISPECIES: hypothetical protein [unclassified Streptomyces]
MPKALRRLVRDRRQGREELRDQPPTEAHPEDEQEADGAQEQAAAEGEPATDRRQGRGELRDQPPTEADPETETSSRGGRVQFIVAVVVAGLLVVSGVVLFYLAHELRTEPATRNHALTDADATNRVNGDVSSALAKIFSYTPDGTNATARTANQVLTGKAAKQYAELFTQVQKNAPAQKVTLTTDAVRVGTVSLRGDTAHLLVFLDQSTHRGDKKAVTSAAQLSVTAQLHNDVWQIVDIKAR